MYIRKASRTYKGKTYVNYLLVESVATPKGPRQKVICSLGDLSPRSRGEWLRLAHKLESALSGQSELLVSGGSDELRQLVAKVHAAHPTAPSPAPGEPAMSSGLVAVHIDRVHTEQCREAGPVHVGYQFWLRLGVDGILADAGMSERARQVTCAMVFEPADTPGQRTEHASLDPFHCVVGYSGHGL